MLIMEKKYTLVVGASEKRMRYSNMAVNLLTDYDYPVYAFGLRKGMINDIEIQTEWPSSEEFHTVTMYIGPQNQIPYYDRIVNLKPQRIIFNPGTENEELASKLKTNGVEVVVNCTLVMLNGGLF